MELSKEKSKVCEHSDQKAELSQTQFIDFPRVEMLRATTERKNDVRCSDINREFLDEFGMETRENNRKL